MMAIEKFLEIINKPMAECSMTEIDLKFWWRDNNFKRIFEVTGLDLSNFSKESITSQKKIIHG